MTIVVITPAFNASATLAQTLASVVAQARQPDEVIVANDCSTDDTVAIAESFADRLPIRVVTTPTNLGPAGARALAIEHSSSDLIATLDSDDVMLPNHLAVLLAAYESTDDGLASANTRRWIPERDITSEHTADELEPVPSTDQLAWLLRSNHLSIAALFSRRRYDAVGGFRREFFGTEDWDLWVRLVRSGARIVRPAEATLLYRLSEANVSSADRLINAKLQVLDAAAREGGPDEADAIAVGRRELLAADQLNQAYALANSGKRLAARRAGLRALRGIKPVAIRGAAMALAPRTVAKRREAVRFRTDVWMKRYGNKGS